MALPAVELSVVVPVYNSAGTLRELCQRLHTVLSGLRKSFEIILVDDGSRDDSWTILAELHRQHPDTVVAVQLMRNYGQHNTLMCGLRRARGAFVITLDDDLQNPPEEIPKLLDAIERTGADLVFGRFSSKQHQSWRNLGSWLLGQFYRRVFHTRVMPSPYRIMRRELAQSIFGYRLNFTIIDGLLAWNTQRIESVEVDHHPRAVGRSGYSIRKLLVVAFNSLTNFSIVPLQIASTVGLLTATGGILTGAYYVIQYLRSNIGPAGYASTITAILVLGGLQLMALGVIGEYLGRVHLNISSKPQYAERIVLRARREGDHPDDGK